MKKIFFVVAALLLLINAHAQQKYKIYLDTTDNKLYYNKKLPVYFWISDKPDESGTDILLKSKVPKFANPYYFDTEGINTFRVKNPKGPFQEAIFEIWADDRPPLIKYAVEANNKYRKGRHIFLGKNTKIKLSGIDGLSRVDKIYFTIDSNKFRVYQGPITLNKSGIVKLKYFGCDIVGNCSDTIEETFYMDTKPPIVKFHAINSNCDSILGRKSKIEFIAKDDHTGVKAIYYSLKKNGPFRRYNYPILLTQGTEGYHTLYYYATDYVNNKSDIKTYRYYIDVTPPKVKIKILGNYDLKNNIYYVSPYSKLTIKATDNKKVKNIFYVINGKKYTYTDEIDLSGFYGLRTIFYYATDIAGNKSAVKTIKVFIDNTAPITRINIGTPKFIDRDTIFISSNTLISFSASDRYSKIKRIEYAINNQDFKPFKSKFLLDKEGLYNIYYRSEDDLGNLEQTKVSKIYVDNTPPEIKIIFSVEPYEVKIEGNDTIPVYPSKTKIYLGAVDEKTGEEQTYYSLNNSPFILYNHPITIITQSAEQKFNLRVKSKDKLGNQAIKEVNFIIRNQ